GARRTAADRRPQPGQPGARADTGIDDGGNGAAIRAEPGDLQVKCLAAQSRQFVIDRLERRQRHVAQKRQRQVQVLFRDRRAQGQAGLNGHQPGRSRHGHRNRNEATHAGRSPTTSKHRSAADGSPCTCGDVVAGSPRRQGGGASMKAGISALVAGYVLSQFYRAFLAVLSPVLGQEIGASAADLALSSGIWFFVFALMQIPVGMALDRLGPRRTASVLLAAGGAGGAAVFAAAGGPGAIHLAMALIGIGCSPVLMASYFIFARQFPPAVFGTLAGAVIGVGSLGNIAGAAPLASLVGWLGWRLSLLCLSGATLAIAAAIFAFVRDPAPVPRPAGGDGGFGQLIRVPGLWAFLPLM